MCEQAYAYPCAACAFICLCLRLTHVPHACAALPMQCMQCAKDIEEKHGVCPMHAYDTYMCVNEA